MKKLVKGPTKERRLTNYPDMPQILLSTIYDSLVFSFEINKGLECSQSPVGKIYYLLI